MVGLGNIGKDHVNHGHEHAVLERMPSVLDNGDDVCALGGHVDQITTAPVGELHGVDATSRADNVGDVGDGSTRSTAEVENLGAGLHVDVVDTAQNASGKLGSEGVPHAVFGFSGNGCVGVGTIALGAGSVNADALLTVYGLAGGQVLSDEEIFLAASDEDAGVSVRLL